VSKEVKRGRGEVNAVGLGVVDSSDVAAVAALTGLAVAVSREVLDILGLASDKGLLSREILRRSGVA
jgi:hypothetical protein